MKTSNNPIPTQVFLVLFRAAANLCAASNEIVSPTICVMPVNCFYGWLCNENRQKVNSFVAPFKFVRVVRDRSSILRLIDRIHVSGRFFFQRFVSDGGVQRDCWLAKLKATWDGRKSRRRYRASMGKRENIFFFTERESSCTSHGRFYSRLERKESYIANFNVVSARTNDLV